MYSVTSMVWSGPKLAPCTQRAQRVQANVNNLEVLSCLALSIGETRAFPQEKADFPACPPTAHHKLHDVHVPTRLQARKQRNAQQEESVSWAPHPFMPCRLRPGKGQQVSGCGMPQGEGRKLCQR